jgi:hypothetical protein
MIKKSGFPAILPESRFGIIESYKGYLGSPSTNEERNNEYYQEYNEQNLRYTRGRSCDTCETQYGSYNRYD